MPVFLNGKWRIRVFRTENGSGNQWKTAIFLPDVAASPRDIAEATAQCWPFRQASLAIEKQLRWQARNQALGEGGREYRRGT